MQCEGQVGSDVADRGGGRSDGGGYWSWPWWKLKVMDIGCNNLHTRQHIIISRLYMGSSSSYRGMARCPEGGG